jgi:PAS domain S-box-containing protein
MRQHRKIAREETECEELLPAVDTPVKSALLQDSPRIDSSRPASATPPLGQGGVLPKNRHLMARFRFLAFWFLTGAAFLCLLATLQHFYLRIPLSLNGYLLPFLFGGLAGLLIGSWELRLQGFSRRLAESERRFRSLYQNTPVMLHSINADGRILNVSNYWLQTLGYRREEVVGRPLSDFLSERSRRFANDSVLPEFARAGYIKDIPHQMLKKTGEVIHVLFSAIAEYD